MLVALSLLDFSICFKTSFNSQKVPAYPGPQGPPGFRGATGPKVRSVFRKKKMCLASFNSKLAMCHDVNFGTQCVHVACFCFALTLFDS